MDITWDPQKERKLRKERGIDIREIADLIVDGKYTALLENPSRPSQFIFVLLYRGYTHVVPFVIAKDETIVLKTVFASRKFHQLYGEDDETKT
jgi:uncharacterized DUF497 family protein